MTAFAAVLSVLLAVALYAIVSFCRFPRMRLSALAEYASQPDVRKPNYALGFLFFAIWALVLWLLVRTGHDLLVGALWAGTIIATLFLSFRQNSHPPTCEKCGAPMQTFRKEHERVVPAILYLHVCHKCKVYREQLVIAVAGE